MRNFTKYTLFIISSLIILISTYSCDSNIPEPDITPIIMNDATAAYFGSEKEGEVDHVVVQLVSDNLKFYFGKAIGNGELLQIYLLSEPLDRMDITSGTYPIKVYNDSYEVGTAIGGEILEERSRGTLLISITDSEHDKVFPITNGEVKVEKTSGIVIITASFEIDGEKKEYTYSGVINIKNGR